MPQLRVVDLGEAGKGWNCETVGEVLDTLGRPLLRHVVLSVLARERCPMGYWYWQSIAPLNLDDQALLTSTDSRTQVVLIYADVYIETEVVG